MNAPADIPVAYTWPGSTPDAEVRGQLGDQPRDEPDVVDPLLIGRRRTAAVGPAEVDAVGVDHHEPVCIGRRVVVRYEVRVALPVVGVLDPQHRFVHVRARGQSTSIELQ